jgi:cyanophycin synthetase
VVEFFDLRTANTEIKGVSKLIDKNFLNMLLENASGSKLSTFAVTLEAWRRGLTIVFKDKTLTRYTICGDRSLEFLRSRLDNKYSEQPRKICGNKELTKNYLRRANVPVPEGKLFHARNADEEIIEYTRLLNYPVVLKPSRGSGGKGVITNIQDESSLYDFLIYVRHELNFPEVIIEKHIDGEDYRVNVVGKNVVRAVKRVPANIIGDGMSSVKQLIHNKNNTRKKHPFLSKKLIKIDKEVFLYLEKAGYHLQSVPGEGELIYLRGKSNLSAGGDSICVTSQIPEIIKKTAVRAVEAIPDLNVCGVDIIFDNTKDSNAMPVVLELNSKALVGQELLDERPANSDSVTSAIIDFYFPESCKNRSRNRNLFFNLKSAIKPLKDGVASEVTLAPAPTGEVVSKRIELSGLLQGVNFQKWAKKNALNLKLSGYMKFLSESNLVIIIAGNKEDVEKFEGLCLTGPKKARIDSVTTKPWDKMVMAGFYIKNKNKQSKSLKKLKKQSGICHPKSNLEKQKILFNPLKKKQIYKIKNYFKKFFSNTRRH